MRYVIQSQTHKEFYMGVDDYGKYGEWRPTEADALVFETKREAELHIAGTTMLFLQGWGAKVVLATPTNEISDDWVDAQLYY